MPTVTLVLMFCGGVIIGLILFPLIKLIDGEVTNRLLELLARSVTLPFAWLGRLVPRKRETIPKIRYGEEAAAASADARERQLRESAQTIRAILLNAVKVMQQTDRAASDSSQVLDDIRGSFERLDLTEAHRIVMREIDRVISSNMELKGELASAQEALAEQRSQIESLRTAVRIDGLTRLANRAYFDEKLTESLELLKRYDEIFSLMMIDLDNFKEINDRYGHPAGDRILKGVAFKIRDSLRSSDFLARFGGDEFALILPKADADTACEVAWKLCTSLRESRFLLDDSALTLTLSIGVTEADGGDSEEGVLKRADEALYRVKQGGRDNVLLAEKPAPRNDTPRRNGRRQKP